MKRKRRLFGILFVITALIIMQLPVAEADAATSASDFKMEGNTLVKYRGTAKDVSIPDTVEIIGENAFEENTNIESLVIPNSVKEIEAYAFWGCENLETVSLGSGLTEIGDYVFTNCKGLKKMTIPSTIKSIGIYSFADCVNMTDINIDPAVFNIHETAFDGCYKLMIHAEWGSYAYKYAEEFYERQKEMPEYEDVSDYDSDKEDEEETEAVVEESTGDTIGSTKVVGNQAVVFMDNTSLLVCDGEEDMDALEAVQQDREEYTGDGIPKYTIVDGTVVADQAYYRSKKLQGVTLPDGIREIGQFAFARSTVTEVVIPKGTENIGYGAFYHCDSLEEIVLPNTIINVEPKAFTYSAWVDNFLESGNSDFLISGDVLVAYRGSGEHVTIPDGVRVIAGEVFAGHTEIKELSLPDSLTTIGEAAFTDCTGLRTVFWGNQIQMIKDRAFANCALVSASIPATVEELGLQAFDENVQMKYGGGHIPKQSHELSAERLSNTAYRPSKEEGSVPGATVYGLENAFAHLEGADRGYSLTVAETADKSIMEQAFMRSMQSNLPADMIVYDLLFTDNSGIPITKLGKQPLKITLPVPESLASQNLVVYTFDRNGQLEEVEAERVKLDGVDSFRFTLNYISQIGVVGNGIGFDESYVLEETTSIVSMSSGPKQNEFYLPVQWIVGGILLLVGLFCIFGKGKRI